MQTTKPYQTTAPTFRYNHLKNYAGVIAAYHATGATGPLVTAHVVRGAGAAKQGAIDLGLLDEHGDPTTLGERLHDTFVAEYGDADTALEQFNDWKGTTTRFINLDGGVFEEIAPAIMTGYPATNIIVDVLSDADTPRSLPELVHECLHRDQEVAEQLFIRDSVTLPDAEAERADRLFSPDVYRCGATCQFKTLLYHAGIVSETGNDSSRLAPQTDVWELDAGAPVEGGDAR